MAGVRFLKVSTLQFWSSFIFGSAISFGGLFNMFNSKSQHENQVNKDTDIPLKDSGPVSDCHIDLWSRIAMNGSGWINHLLEDISASMWQEDLTEVISNALTEHFSAALSSKWACESGVTKKAIKALQDHSTRKSRLAMAHVIAALDVNEEEDTEDMLSCCDERLLIGLARLPVINKTILKSFHSMNKSKQGDQYCDETIPMEKHFKSLLLSLPLYGMDACTKWFTKNAILTGSSAKQHKRSLSWSFGGDSSLSFAHNFTSMPAEQIELYYLKAFTKHSMVSGHSQIMVENGILHILHREIMQRRNNLRISQEMAHILGNLALDEITHTDIIQQGFLSVLRSWLFSEDLTLSTHAARALANLDRDYHPGESYDEGVYLLHPDKRHRSEIAADVVFVHGLRGGPLKTWRVEGTSRMLKSEDCWPKAWLVNDFPDTRLIMVEYDSSLSNWVSQCPTKPEMRSVAFRSEQIMKKLQQAGVGKRPVIWISHSMGGLLVKQLLLHAQEDKTYRSMCDKTIGIVFYSTPHKGSALASYSSQARYLLLPSVEVKELCLGSSYLSNLHNQFLDLLNNNNIECLSIGETIPLQLSWVLNSVLVAEDSANFGRGLYFPLYTNHINVCKPTSPSDPRYYHTKAFIQRILPTKP